MTDPTGKMEVNWRLLGGMLVVGVLLVVAWKLDAIARAGEWIDDLGHADVPPWIPTPDTLSGGSIESQRARLTAARAFEIQENGVTLRAFAWEESDGNWTLVFYRRSGSRYERFGSIANPSGFDAPHLAGTPPSLRMRDRNLDVDFAFTIVEDDTALVPVNADLVPVAPE